MRSKTDETTAYNYLMLSIIQYNNQYFIKARNSVINARRYVDSSKASVLDYVDALLNLIEGKEQVCIELLSDTTKLEPQAIPPYIVLAQIHLDNERYGSALNALKLGLNEADDDDCTLNWMAGNCLYAQSNYKQAISYYKAALSNMTINEMEAMYKVNIAKCYRKLGDSKSGRKWLEDAIGEVKKNATMIDELRHEYWE